MESVRAVQKQKNKEETIWRLSESDCLMRCTRPTAGVFPEPQRRARRLEPAQRLGIECQHPFVYRQKRREINRAAVSVLWSRRVCPTTCRVVFCQVWQQTAGAKRQVVEVHLASCEVMMVRCRKTDDIASFLSAHLRPSLDRPKLGCRLKVWSVPNLLYLILSSMFKIIEITISIPNPNYTY